MNSNNHNYVIRNLVEISPEELFELALLHQDCLPYTIGSMLGPQHLVSYYFALRENVDSVSKVAFRDNQVIGLICSTTRKGVKNKAEKKFTVKIFREIIKPCFLVSNFSSLFDLLHIRILQSKLGKEVGYISIFFVSSSVRKSGVGSKLLTECIALHREHKMESIYVDTRKFSESALAIYMKFGFIQTKRTVKSILLKKSL